jgi:O-antigen ligase
MAQYLNIRINNPIQQGVIIFICAILLMIFSKVGSKADFPWLTSGAFLLFFAVANNVQSIFSEHYGRYIQQSVLTFLTLLVGLGFMAYLVSGLTIFNEKIKYYRIIYMVLIMAYFTLMALCFVVRSLVDYLRIQDQRNHGIK